MLDFIALVPQIEAMADHFAGIQAEVGLLEWTPALVRARNRRTLEATMPLLLRDLPGTVEDAFCAAGCGGLCLITHSVTIPGKLEPQLALVHTCQRCRRAWAVPLAFYRGEDASIREVVLPGGRSGAAPA